MPFKDDIEEGDEEAPEKKKTPPIFRKDQHLSTALLSSEIDYYIKYKNDPEKIKREHRLLQYDTKDIRFNHIDDYFAQYLRHIFTVVNTRDLQEARNEFYRTMAIARMATKWNVENWTKKEYFETEQL